MVEVEDLRNRNPRAWTLLLTQGFAADDLIVTAVGEEPVETSSDVSRFLLTLAGYQEPLSLIGKRTNAVEVLFYEAFAPKFTHFTPRCWFSHIGLDDNWLVLSEVRNDHPPETWNAKDYDIVIGNLASLHAAYWGKGDVLDQYGLPFMLEDPEARAGSGAGESGEEDPTEQPTSQMERIERWLQGQRRYLTEHAIRSAGPSLTPLLARAGNSLETLTQLNGWPGIVDDRHLTALADLLDDPLPMLYPLRQLPYTLLHGDPSAERWHLTLFDDYYLMEWQQAAIGPGITDLVSFVDHLEVHLDAEKGWRGRRPERASEETMIDSYILAMRGELGTRFDARAIRLAMPAARCFLVLTRWLPRLGDWLQELQFDTEVWQAMSDLPDEQLEDAGLAELVDWKTALAKLFDRFLGAYRRL